MKQTTILSIGVIFLLALFTSPSFAERDYSFQDSIKRVYTRKVLKVGNSYKAFNINIEQPIEYKRLQKYLSYVVFKSAKPTIEEGFLDFLEMHEAKHYSPDSIDTDTVKCEINFHPRFNTNFLSIHLAIPELYRYGQNGRIRIRVIERDFIYDCEREKILLYNDIFSENYSEPFVNTYFSERNRIDRIIKDRNTAYEDSIFPIKEMVWNFILGEDYIEYTPYFHQKKEIREPKPQIMKLADCVPFLNPNFRNKIQTAFLKHNADLENNPVAKLQRKLKNEQASIIKQAHKIMEEKDKKEREGKSQTPKLVNIYTNDKNPFEDMHFYSPSGRAIFLSGLNKDIKEITAEDIEMMSSKKKLECIVNELTILRDMVEDKGEKVFDSNDIKLSKKPSYVKSEKKFKDTIVKALTTNDDTEYGTIDFMVIIDKDGSLLAPTIYNISGTNENKLKHLKKFARTIRKMKMNAGEIDGQKVRTLWGGFLSFQKYVTTERY